MSLGATTLDEVSDLTNASLDVWEETGGCLLAPSCASTATVSFDFIQQPGFEGGAVFYDNASVDVLAPTIYCSDDVITLTDPTATDDCGAPVITNDAPATFASGPNIVTYTATDIGGNTSTCQELVYVLDEITADVTFVSCGLSGTAIVPLLEITNVIGGIPELNCTGDYTLSAVGGTLSATTYSYDSGATIELAITAVTGGDYSITITDAQGCSVEITGSAPSCEFGDIALSDPCSCNDDQSANGAMDGTFGELVEITGPAGFDLVIGAGSTGIIGFNVGDPIPEVTPGVYQLAFDHLDLVGYTIFISAEVPDGMGGVVLVPVANAGGAQLTASNVCQYPVITEPDIASDIFCFNGDALVFDGSEVAEVNGLPGVVSVFVDATTGTPITSFDPTLYAQGTYELFFVFDGTFVNDITNGTDPAYPGCFTYTSIEVIVSDGGLPVCNDHINISLDENCEALITADMLLEGNEFGELYTVSLSFNGAPVAQSDLGNYIGEVLQYTATNDCTGNSCWGTLTIEDKLPPQVELDVPMCELNSLTGVWDANDGLFSPGTCWAFDGGAPQSDILYDVIEFTAPCDGDFTFTMTDSPDFDGIAGIYEGSFDPTDACGVSSPIAGDDDLPGIFESEPSFTFTATAGVTYFLVSSTWGTGQMGIYEWTFTGPCALMSPCMFKCYDLQAFLDGDFPVPGPTVSECSSFDVSVNDWVDNSMCGATIVTRTYLVTDANGNVSEEVSQQYVFESLNLGVDIILPQSPIQLTCGAGTSPDDLVAFFDNPLTTDNQGCNPASDNVEENNEGNAYGYPTFIALGCDGLEHSQAIKDNVCSIGVTYTDLVIDACNPGCNSSNEKIIRTWTILDWCEAQNGDPANATIMFDQVIKAVDDNAPTMQVEDNLSFSTDPWGCQSHFALPIPDLHDGCDSDVTYTVHGPAGSVVVYDAALGQWMATVGKSPMDPATGAIVPHVFTYTATDCCKNVGTHDINVTVFDGAPPVAIAKQNIVLSLSSSSTNGEGFGKIFAWNVDDGSFDGCGNIKLEIRRDTDPECGVQGNTTYDDDFPFHTNDGVSSPTSSLFDGDNGEFVSFCCADVNQEIKVWLRVWDDANMDGVPGNIGDNFNETWVNILIEEKTPPILNCPANIEVACGWDWQTQTDLATAYDVCGPVEVVIDNVTDNTNACGIGLIRVRYCTVPQSADEAPVCCTQNITVVDGGTEFDVNSINFQNDRTIVCNDIPEPTAPIWGEGMCDLVGWTSSDQNLWFEDGACRKVIRTYTVSNWCTMETETHQTIFTVIDTEAAEFEGENVMFAVDNATDLNEDCAHDAVILTMTGTDGTSDCESEWLEWKVEIDLWGDGSIDKVFAYTEGADEGFNPNSDNDQDGIMYMPKSANGATVSVNLGAVAASCNNHIVTWTINDGCNNVSSLVETFMVVDKKDPTPYCKSVSTAIMPAKGFVELWASDFDLGSFDLCGDVLVSFSNTEYQPNMNFTCDMDVDGDGIVELPIYVWDSACTPNIAECVVELTLSNCDGNDAMRTISGTVSTETGEDVEDAMMVVSTDAMSYYPLQDMTDGNGSYAFMSNPMHIDYVLEGEKNDDYMNGVSTLDLVLIQKHILQSQVLDSPYKMIAADINGSQTISAIDLVELRKLILGIYTELPNNDSWRFVNGDQNLSVLNPWIFTETINVDNLESDMMSEDFVGVKIGDVNGSVVANATGVSTENRSGGALTMEIKDRAIVAGQTITVDVMSSNYSEVNGYQFTMNFDGVEMTDIQGASNNVTTANVSVSTKTMAMSYHELSAQTISAEDVLFTMTLTANKSGNLSDMISINGSVTRAEAYVGAGLDIVDVELGVRNDGEVEIVSNYELFQNEPNPFNGRTQIGFSLPQAAQATLNVYDVTGKVIKSVSNDYEKGYHTINITKSDLGASTGVLYYQLESGDFTATKKMIVIAN